jgi:transglutaminase-like putative cysteine protease
MRAGQVMSGVQVAVLPGGAGPPALSRPVVEPHRERIGVEVGAFAALGLYGVLRWDTLLSGAAFGRLAGLLALSALLAIAGPRLARRRRWLAGLAFVAAALGTLMIAGLPLDWVGHLRVAVSARAIGDGLSALPQITVPYTGINQWVRATLLLGAIVLLLGAALVLTFVPARSGLARRAGAALLLIALAVIPAVALRPRSPYLEGVLLFALVVAFVWGDQVDGHRLGGLLAPCAAAALVGVALAPAVDGHRGWIDYRQLAASLAPGGVESFNWTQGYGPLHWPHTGRAVMEVQASHPDYWKAENLDVFNGRGWVSTHAPASIPWQAGLSASAIVRWSQTLQVTMDSLSTSDVIGSGSAETPSALPGRALAGTSSGTWQSSRRLVPGASYRVTVYAPHPSAAQLASAGTAYPAALQRAYLSVTLPDRSFPIPVVFPPFAAKLNPNSEAGTTLAASPYVPVFALAQRLKAGSATPYAYVQRVESYLAHGYTYSQSPPVSHYPLKAFLFVHRLGYCQHFAGAMALLLRLGGVPARVAVGFTPGTYDRASRKWVVSDLDAHAWVEAWFPQYGWVRFDPTPSVDPALAPTPSAPGVPLGPQPKQPSAGHRHEISKGSSPGGRGGAGARSRRSGASAIVIAPAAILALMLLLALLTRARAGQDPVGELTTAFARSGRPLDGTATLSALEQRLAHAPDAAGYLRILRLARYGPGAAAGGAESFDRRLLRGRRALRRALGAGLGPIGRVRAWWALPPRWRWPGAR